MAGRNRISRPWCPGSVADRLCEDIKCEDVICVSPDAVPPKAPLQPRQTALPIEPEAHRPDRMGLVCWGRRHSWHAVPCRCDIRLRLAVSGCDQRGLYGDCAHDGPVVRVGSVVGQSRLSRICSISKFTCCCIPTGPASLSLACHRLPTIRRLGPVGSTRSSMTAIG